MKKKTRLLVVMMAAALAAACSAGTIGGIRKSPEVNRQFETLAIRSDYRYWYLNQENNPFGVVGLERDYRLDGDLNWRPVDPATATLAKVVGLVRSFPVPGSYTTGYIIADPQGRPIGVWYSSLPAGILVDPETKAVSVATTAPWLLKENI